MSVETALQGARFRAERAEAEVERLREVVADAVDELQNNRVEDAIQLLLNALDREPALDGGTGESDEDRAAAWHREALRLLHRDQPASDEDRER